MEPQPEVRRPHGFELEQDRLEVSLSEVRLQARVVDEVEHGRDARFTELAGDQLGEAAQWLREGGLQGEREVLVAGGLQQPRGFARVVLEQLVQPECGRFECVGSERRSDRPRGDGVVVGGERLAVERDRDRAADALVLEGGVEPDLASTLRADERKPQAA